MCFTECHSYMTVQDCEHKGDREEYASHVGESDLQVRKISQIPVRPGEEHEKGHAQKPVDKADAFKILRAKFLLVHEIS